MLVELGWDRLAECKKELSLTIMFKIVHGHIDGLFTDVLAPADTCIFSNHSYKYKQIRENSVEYRNSFFLQSIMDWNCLDAKVKISSDTDNFKEHLSHAHHQQHSHPHLYK